MKQRGLHLVEQCRMSPPTRGAWIETLPSSFSFSFLLSPPTRGAWIETICFIVAAVAFLSPPTRGAWIETFAAYEAGQPPSVAPHAGGVD